MKKLQKINVLRVIALSVTVFFFFSCDPTNPIGPEGPDPDDPTPDALVKPEITSSSLESVTENQAIFSVSFKANEKNTKLFLEHRRIGGNYQKLALSGSYTGVDVKKVTADFPELSVKTEYQVRLIAINSAGSDTSITFHISTYIVRDYDNNPYHVIKIGNQYWLQENLKTSHYADGTEIPNVTDNNQWVDTESPAMCYYDNDPENKEKYGALYNGHAAESEKKFIAGYHLPTKEEFEVLIASVGGTKKTYKLCDNGDYDNSWKKADNEEINQTGFTAIPGGFRNVYEGSASYLHKNFICYIWTSSFEFGRQIELTIGYDISNALEGYSGFGTRNFKECGLNIRLIKD